MDYSLLVQWVLGGTVVFLYGRDRFNSPVPARPTTTFTRYWVAHAGYILSMMVLFVIFGGAVTDIELGPIWQFLGVQSEASKLPGPLFSALLLTSLLPRTPYLNAIDQQVKRWFERIGNIPIEGMVLSGEIESAELSISRENLEKLRDDLDALGVDEAWLAAPERSLKRRWARVAVLSAMMRSWSRSPDYSRYIQTRGQQYREIMDRVETLGGLSEAELGEPEQAEHRRDATSRKQLRRDIDELHQHICDFISGGLLEGGWSLQRRHAMLAELGFGGLRKPRTGLTAHEFVMVGGIIFLSMIFVTLVFRRFFDPTPLPLNLRIVVMVPIIYTVAVVIAVYSKTVWRFADIRAVGHHPVAGYVAAGLLAAAAAFIISLLFRFALEESGNLVEVLSSSGRFRTALAMTLDRWPWLLQTLFTTIAIAWVADDYALAPATAPKRARVLEAAGLSALFGISQFMVLELLVAVAGDKAKWAVVAQPRVILTAMVIGACIGYFVPHFCRTKATHSPVHHARVGSRLSWRATRHLPH